MTTLPVSLRSHALWRWFDLVALAFAVLLVVIAAGAAWTAYSQKLPVDFLSYWSAGTLTLGGDPARAYDQDAHRAVETSVAPLAGLLPFPYPPPFLLLVTPFALASFWVAFPLWLLVSGAFYAFAARRLAAIRYALAQGPAFSVALGGQNGFVTSGLFILGTSLLDKRAFLGGAVLGLLVIKPQLALMLPVAMLAARQWTAIAGGVASASLALLAALLAFGPGTYAAFFAALPAQAAFLGSGQLDWADLGSLYAFGRFAGAPHALAMSVHVIVALAAALLVWRAWAQGLEERVPILAAATLLASPYLFTYDGLLLLVPIAFLVRERRSAWGVAAIWLLGLLPMARGFAGYPGPNSLPIAALVALAVLHQAQQKQQRGRHEHRPDNVERQPGEEISAERA